MATHPKSQPPPSHFSSGDRRSALPPFDFDSAPPSLEDPRRPLASMTTERGGLAGGVDSPDLPASDSSIPLTSLPHWPFTPLPSPSPVESDDSYCLPSLPPWCPQPLPCDSSDSYVEETHGIWSPEAEPVVENRKVEAGLISAPLLGDVAAGVDEGLDLVEIAKLRGWEGPMDPDTLWLLGRLIPAFFRPPYVRSFANPILWSGD